MSDNYVALVDCGATPAQATELAGAAVEILSRAGLIVPTLTPDCVLGGVGYPAGPGCAAAYRADDRTGGNRFWTLTTSGLEIHAAPWVNLCGFTQFTGAECPRCGQSRGADFLDDVGDLVDDYLRSGAVPGVRCPACGSTIRIPDWKCDPHLGFGNLAMVFWNWPPFGDEWRVNVHLLLEDRLKRRLVSTFGRI